MHCTSGEWGNGHQIDVATYSAQFHFKWLLHTSAYRFVRNQLHLQTVPHIDGTCGGRTLQLQPLTLLHWCVPALPPPAAPRPFTPITRLPLPLPFPQHTCPLLCSTPALLNYSSQQVIHHTSCPLQVPCFKGAGVQSRSFADVAHHHARAPWISYEARAGDSNMRT